LAIRFFSHHVNYRINGKRRLKTCVEGILTDHRKKVGEINIIITDDYKLLEINKKYLLRDYFTDIITFDLSEDEKISGDLYISIDRVKENAVLFDVEKEKELFRVIIHGILHLIGYKDKKSRERKEMTEKEDFYIRINYKKGSYNL
jgi:probable rRNA maturation factor